MKTQLLLLLIVLTAGIIWAHELQQPFLRAEFTDPHHFRIIADQERNDHPEITFETGPSTITFSMYDYMPGGYNIPPFGNQPVISQPEGFPADGIYLAFMYQQNSVSLRRIYYTYIDSQGNFQPPNAVSSTNIKEGFAGIAVDPVTANPFVAWHNIVEPDESYDCSFSFDLFNVIGSPGLWNQAEIFVDNPELGVDLVGINGAEYIWPELRIGPSPLPGYQRLHVLVTNSNPNGQGDFLDNIIYGYSDFQYDENSYTMLLTDWSFQTFPEIDDWWINDIKRAIKDYAVSDDGQVLIIGHAGQSYLAYHSTDYGESFTYIEQEACWDIFEPYIIDPGTGEPLEPYFEGEDCMIEPNSDGKHYNVLFIADNSKAIFMTAFGVNTYENVDDHLYLPAFFEPKIVIFDIATQQFTFTDLQVPGLDAYDDQPMIPWDLNEDGEVDEYDEDGYPVFVDCWPTYFYAGDYGNGSFHESLFKMAKNEEMGWLVTLFQDGRKLKNAFYDEPGYEEWIDTPEIAIAASFDNGETWSYPSYLNAKTGDENYFPELEGMIPEYVYISEEIEYVDENLGRIHMFFLDDYSYGSFVGQNNHGLQNGGDLTYATLLVNFDFEPMQFTSNDNKIVQSSLKLYQNYPNPFNPVTNIKFSLKTADHVTLEVFNIKGQKVRTLVNDYRSSGDYQVTWDGRDEKYSPVNSGLYLYKLRVGKETSTRKMLLLK
ncbi:MAG: T9SS type A sorting domain-containing protein [Candidatus Cloacimonetes bacterium]|nr:T9SS type A sorting domain-containing protein [Candidatus Cloacimonadota bacterium]